MAKTTNTPPIKKNTPTIFDTLYFGFFLILPLIYFDKLVDPVLIPRQIFLSLFVAIIGLLICAQVSAKKLQSDFSFLRLSVFLVLVLFVVSIIFSFFQSIAISESIYKLSKIGIEILFFILTTFLLIQKKISIPYLIRSVIGFGLVTMGIAVFQLLKLSLLGNNFFESILEVSASFGHKNLLASALFLTFPFLLNSTMLSKIWKKIAVGLGLSMLLMVWLIQTKAVIVAFGVFFFVFLALLLRFRNSVGNKVFVKVMILSVSLLLILASIFTVRNKEKFPRIFDKKSSFERMSLWENSVEMIKENFMFGVGAGNWQVHFPKSGLDKFNDVQVKNGLTTFQRPHNDFLWVFCEMGVFGFLLYASIFIIILYYLFKLLKKCKGAENRWLFSAFTATIVSYLLISLVDFPFERIEHQVLIYMIFALITAHLFEEFSSSRTAKTITLSLPTLLGLVFIPVSFSFVVSCKRCIGEYHTQRLYSFEHQSKWNHLIKEADKAINSCYSMDPMSAPIEWYKGVALFSLGDITAAQGSFERAYQINPYNIHVMNNLASCYESLQDHKKAEEFYLKALSISSDFEEARLNLSAVYYNTKEYNKAFEVIDKCNINSIDPKYRTFLPFILNSWMEIFVNDQNDKEIVEKISIFKNSKDKTMQYYFESKRKGITFAQYILNNTK